MTTSPSQPAGLSPLKRALLALEEMQARLESIERGRTEPIAVIGLGGRFPGGEDPEAFWRLLREGGTAITEVPPERWDVDRYYDPDPDAPGKVYTRFGGFLGCVDLFDAQHFGIAPREAESMDPQQRLLLETAWEALEDAGQAPDRLAGSRTGVFVGIASSDYGTLSLKHDPGLAGVDAYRASGNAHSVASGRLSYVFGLQGPSISLDTACSSSLVAVHLACQSLRVGECRMALAGGVHLNLSPENTITFCKSRMLAADGRCKTFDAAADGFVEGEGCGLVVLKRLSDAEADGDRVLALIRASALNQDGASSGLTAPNGPAQEALLREALGRAGVAPEEVGYVEAHGTGTALGDPIEMQALGAVLCRGRDKERPLLVGSIKTNVGHLEAAAGVAGLIKVVLALQHEEIPPHLHFREPSPHIPWAELSVAVPTALTPWKRGARRRIAGVSSFGFSGTNAHVVVEEAPLAPAPAPPVDRPQHLLTLSGRTEKARDEVLALWMKRLADDGQTTLADLAFSANAGRSSLSHRVALLATSREQACERLGALAAAQTPPGTARGHVGSSERPRLAFLFTGQGSQYAGMGRQLYQTQPTFRRALERCDEALRAHLDLSLLEVLHGEADPSRLDATACTQPALFALEWALAELWRSWGITPSAVMGHSLGEYVAACRAGVFSLEDALALVAARGRLMGSLPPGGGMWAVSASEAQVREALRVADGSAVSIAAVNGPEDVVLSGDAAAAEAVVRRLEAAGARTKRLAVSHAFHSPLMDPVLDEFERLASGVSYAPPRCTLVSNLTGGVGGEEVAQPAYWRRHLREPVRFADGMAALHGLGYRVFLEVGPHPTLLGLGRVCLPDEGTVWLPSLGRGREDWPRMLESLAELYVRGAEVDWTGFDRDYGRRKVAAPRYPFQRERRWFTSSGPSRPLPAAVPPRERGAHPLLGTRLRSALEAVQFESRLELSALPYLGDHRKYGTAVFPATAYMEMGLAAAAATWPGGAHAFEDLVVMEPLILPAEEECVVHVVLTPDGTGSASFQLFSLDPSPDGGSWRLHATGALRAPGAAPVSPAPESLPAVQGRCAPAPVEEHYERMAADGHEYGPSFRGIAQLWRGAGEALARLRLPVEAGSSEGYLLHPALLDAGLQVVGAALPPADANGGEELFLPVGIDRYRIHRPPAVALWAHARVRAGDAGADASSFTCDVRLLGDTGEVLAEVDGLRFARARAHALREAIGPARRDWLYEVEWRRQERPSAPVSPAAPGTAGTWLVFADRGGIGAELCRRLSERGERTVVVIPKGGPPDGDGAVPVEPSAPDEFERLCAAHAGALRGVVHLWSLDGVATDDPTAASLQEAAAVSCASVLHLVQALARSGQSPRLWLVTRGARPLDPVRAASVGPAAVLGLARTITAEHPDLRCTSVDLGPAALSGEADALWSEVAEPDDEDQIALRPYGRYVARLVRAASANAPPALEDRPVDLEIPSPGVLQNLRFRRLERRPPGPGQVEIRVEASGLNFRDVLLAFGTYEGPPEPLGREVAGTVSAVGPDVAGVAVGQRVVAALTIGGFRTYALAPAPLVAPRPPRLSAQEAAAVPIVFLTAEYALFHLARLRAGERVLVHAAAGGVGLAAVQLAQRQGAEVLATAGSPAKRAYLSSLGVRHVFDSRSLAFAEGVRGATGGEGVDVVLNSLAGESIAKSLDTLRPGGRFVEIGRAGIWSAAEMAGARPDVAYSVMDAGPDQLEAWAALFRPLLDRFGTGELRPLPHTPFPLAEAVSAFRYMAQARHIGKIVLVHPAAPRPDAPVRADGTYLVTGGGGALGRRVAAWLVERGARTLVLVGRRVDSAEAAEAVRPLESAGARVLRVAGDVADEAFVARLVARIEKDGPALRGVVHAAGVMDDGVLVHQDAGRFRCVLAPKVSGAWALHRATAESALDFFVMFSSMVSQLPAPGQGSYAAANAVLDALAQHRRAQGLPALSVNWGPWTEGMAARVDERDRQRWSRQGLGALDPAQGLAVLDGLLRRGVAQATVLRVDWSRRWAAIPAEAGAPLFVELARGSRSAVRPGPPVDLVREVGQAPPNQRRAVVEAHLRGRAARVLGLDPSEPIDARRPLSEIGLDSLMAVELRNVIGQSLGRTLPATLLFKHPTLEALTDFLMRELSGPVKRAEGPVTDAGAPGDASIDAVARLSADEVQRLLADELRSIVPGPAAPGGPR